MQITTIQTNPHNKYSYPQNNKSLQFGQYVSKLGRKIDAVLQAKQPSQKSLNTLQDELIKFVENPKNERRLKGRGYHSNIYAIDDKYVLKIKRDGDPALEKNIELRKPLFSELKTYYGDPLILFGDLKILKNVSSNNKHLVAGVPLEIVQKGEMSMDGYYARFAHFNNNAATIKYYNEVYLPTFANLPQASFDRLAKDLAILNQKGINNFGFSIDTNNPNNIVLIGKSSLRIVDDINLVTERKPNSVAGMLNMLLVKTSYDKVLPYFKKEIDLPLKLQLLKKIVIAGEKNDLPLVARQEHESNVWGHVAYSFNEFGNKVVENIQRLRDTIPNKKQRIIEVEKYIDTLGENIERNSN